MTLTNSKFLLRAEEVNGRRYDYSLVNYKHSREKITIICREHGPFEQVAYDHLRGSQCKDCAKKLINYKNNKRKTVEQFINDATKLYGQKYDYSLVVYYNANTKVKIICNEHNIFEQTPSVHLNGNGCPKCSLTNTKSFIESAKKIHGPTYDYSLVEYIRSNTKVKIICQLHGIFEQTPNKHISGKAGCPSCCHIISKIENLWLDKMGITIRQHPIICNGKKFIVDGYDPSTNTIYEFNGDYWHGNPKKFNPFDMNTSVGKTFGELYEMTIEKEKHLIEAGFSVISKWETE